MPLMTTKPMFDLAYAGGFAVGAFNVCNLEGVQAVFDACAKEQSPLILQISRGGRKYARYPYLKAIIDAAAAEYPELPFAIHCDHADSVDLVSACVRDGYTSVMFDGSAKPYEENVRLTAEAVRISHAAGVVAEGELCGSREVGEPDLLRFNENGGDSVPVAGMTDPAEAVDFVRKTKVDSLAIAVGNSHGANKSKDGVPISLDQINRIADACPGVPLVIHGASALPRELTDLLKKNGGAAPPVQGISDDRLSAIARTRGLCKVNIDTDLRLAMTATIRDVLASKPAELDLRCYLGAAREAMTQMVRHKVKLLNCAGQARAILEHCERPAGSTVVITTHA